jgi:iron complex outermembrane receptor protein
MVISAVPVRSSTLAYAIALALATTGTASAQQGGAATSSGGLEEVIVTATRRPVDIQTVPLAITAVAGAQLVEMQITNIQNLDKVIPGLTLRSAGYSTSAIIRGAGSAGTNDIAVPFYSDGMYMPSNGQALATFVDIERVEGLRGPQGTLFGRNTFGGLINIITRKPQMGEWDYGAAVTVGDYEQVKLEGMVNVPLGDKVAFRVSASDEKRDPYVENTVNDDGGLKDADNTYVRAQIRFEPIETLAINFSYVDWKDTANGSMNWGYKILGVPLSRDDPTVIDPKNGYLDPRAGIAVGCPDGDRPGGQGAAGNVCSTDPVEAVAALVRGDEYTIQNDVTPVREAHSQAYYLNIGWEVGGHNLRLNAAHFDYEYNSFVDADFTSLANWADGEKIRSKTDQVDLTLTSAGEGRLQYTAGLYYFSRPLDDNSYGYLFASLAESWSGYAGATPATPSWAYWMYEGRSGTESTAIYGQADYSFTDKLVLTLGARYTEDEREGLTSSSLGFDVDRLTSASNPSTPAYDYSDSVKQSGEDSKTDWRVSPQYTINENAMIYASWATAYISGGVNGETRELLEPQENDTYEIGAKTTWLDGALLVNAAIYTAEYTGLTTTVFTVFNGIPVARQIPGGSVESSGLEVEGFWRATDDFMIDFGIAYNDSNYDKFNVASRTGTEGADFIGPDGRGYFVMDGKQTPFSPDLTVSTGLSYDISLGSAGSLTPRALVYYNSGYQTAREHTFFSEQDAYTKLDLSLGWISADRKLSALAFVNNATDEVISTSTDMTPEPNFQAYADYELPRNYGLRLAYRF